MVIFLNKFWKTSPWGKNYYQKHVKLSQPTNLQCKGKYLRIEFSLNKMNFLKEEIIDYMNSVGRERQDVMHLLKLFANLLLLKIFYFQTYLKWGCFIDFWQLRGLLGVFLLFFDHFKIVFFFYLCFFLSFICMVI